MVVNIFSQVLSLIDIFRLSLALRIFQKVFANSKYASVTNVCAPKCQTDVYHETVTNINLNML